MCLAPKCYEHPEGALENVKAGHNARWRALISPTHPAECPHGSVFQADEDSRLTDELIGIRSSVLLLLRG